MFGAYQAGAWEVLSKTFRPDIVVGASIGCLNGWAIAGGCKPNELSRRWLELHDAAQHRWRFTLSPLEGFLQSEQLCSWITDIHRSYRPQTEYGVVLTDLLTLKNVLFTTPEVTSDHLLASCAIFGVFPQVRINGRLYSDGGVINPLPLWAACQMGATEILAINVLPPAPGSVWFNCVRAIRKILPKPPAAAPDIAAPDINVTLLEPARHLGTPRESIYWSQANSARWIEQGRREAEAIVQRKE